MKSQESKPISRRGFLGQAACTGLGMTGVLSTLGTALFFISPSTLLEHDPEKILDKALYFVSVWLA